MSQQWHIHNQLRAVVWENLQIGQAKRRGGSASDHAWNAAAIRSYKTQMLCLDLAKSFGVWVEAHHPEIVWARQIGGEIFAEWLGEARLRGVAGTTQMAYLRRWRKIVRRMEARGWCRAETLLSPLADLRWPRATALERRRRGGGYTESEAQRLVRNVGVRDERAGWVCVLLWRCGLRAEEACTLSRDQMQRGVEEGRFELRSSQAKGGRARGVRVDGRAGAALRAALRATAEPRPLALRATPGESRRYVWKLVKTAAGELGIRMRGLHGFRATAVRRWVRGYRRAGLGERAALQRAAVRAGHGRVDVLDAYTTAGPGEYAPYALPEAWSGRRAELRRLAAAAAAVEALGMVAADVARSEVVAAVRSGALRRRPVDLRLCGELRWVLSEVPRRRYPLRAGLSRPGAVRLRAAHRAGRL